MDIELLNPLLLGKHFVQWMFRLVLVATSPLLRRIALSDTSELPSRHGLRLRNAVIDQNGPLYQDRLFAALDLVSERGPRHLVWLKRHYPLLYIATVPGGTLVQEGFEAGILRFTPQFVWKSTVSELALEIVAAASRRRASKSVVALIRFHNDLALDCLGYRARIWFARRLPSENDLVGVWTRRLERMSQRLLPKQPSSGSPAA